MTTLRGRDLFKGESHALGIFGTLSAPEGSEAITASDCVIAFGASLNRFTTSKGDLLKNKRVVQVDIDAAAIGRHVMPDAGLVGDAALTADLFVRWLDEAEIPGSGFRDGPLADRLAAIPTISSTPRNGPETVDLPTALTALNDAIPEDRLVTTDAGRFLRYAWAAFPVPAPQSFIFTVAIGSIGLGLGHAIGAAAGSPGRPSVLIAGDGGLMLSGLTELHTAVASRLDLVVIVCNDGSYGAEHVQFVDRGMDPSLSLFDWPDFATVARAMGADAVTVAGEDGLAAAISAIGSRSKPLLIDLKLDPDAIISMRR